MNLFIDTSAPVCRLTLEIDSKLHYYEWQADRQLAKDLLGYLRQCLGEHGRTINDVSGIGVFKGPGSFTGLRIGLTVMNTLADGMPVPIVGTSGDTWLEDARRRLADGDNDRIVLPDYGAEAHITKPRK